MPPPPDPDLDSAWVNRVRKKLLAWYEEGHRDLPWRQEHDAYRILVAETMLVQTTVSAVIGYYERFLIRFPTVRHLAEAQEEEVLKAWEGLGYYRRARQLQAAAKAIVSEHGGKVPDDVDALRALPGVGRYIAGAVASFAFDRAAPIVEANTQRVLARWLAWEEDISAPKSQARLWKAAERLVPEQGAGTFNQAFMELGATVCTPGVPLCLLCPVAEECRARALGTQESLPRKKSKPAPLQVEEACALVVADKRVLIVRRGPGGLWEGFWEFPTIHLAGADPGGRSFGEPVDLAEGVRRLTDIRAQVGPAVREVKFSVTKHRVRLTAHSAAARATSPRPGPGLDRAEWVEPGALKDHPFGSPSRRLARWIAEQPNEVLARGLPEGIRYADSSSETV
jgi:A/G-specific adenine glycosylase